MIVCHEGNEQLLLAARISMSAAMGGTPLHLHVEGLRGTGKTTLLRQAKAHLGEIERISGCLYNCDPDAPHCPQHRGLSATELLSLGSEWVPVPFLEISPSAKIGTVVGSIDLGRLAGRERPEAALLPGTLAQAHRGIVFVDEVNRLADIAPELADALLDVMGTKPGRLQIEETGLPRVELMCNVTVWAASNPDEEPGPLGDIRRQLSDRFDLRPEVRRPQDTAAIIAMLSEAAPKQAADYTIAAAAARVPAKVRSRIAEAYVGWQMESLRSALAWQAAASWHAALHDRNTVSMDDLTATAQFVLRDRVDDEIIRDRVPLLPSDLKEGKVLTPAGAGHADGSRGSSQEDAASGSSAASTPSPKAGGSRRSASADEIMAEPAWQFPYSARSKGRLRDV